MKILTLTSVECERVFSHVKLILTRLRNQLRISELNILLMLSRNGPELKDFNDGLMRAM